MSKRPTHEELERKIASLEKEVGAYKRLVNELKESRKHHRRTEQALRESEKRYRSLVENIEFGVTMIDSDHNIVMTNVAQARMFKKPVHEFIGKKCFQEYEKRANVCAHCPGVQAMATGHAAQAETEGVRDDGTRFSVSITAFPILSEEGHPTGFIEIVEDITERKQAEEALRESEEKYRTVLETSLDPIVVYDMEGKVTYFNPAFTRIFGWTLEERLGKTMDLFVPNDAWPETQNMIAKVLAGENFSGFETRRYTKEGDIVYANMSAAIYKDRNGNPIGSVINLRDITEQKKLETQLQQAQKMEAIGTLAGGVAHDFNNLLMGIQGRISLMMTDTDSAHPHNEHLKGIEDYVRSAAELTSQLLAFARGGKYEVKPTDLNELVKNQNRMFGRTRKEVTIRGKYEEELWSAEVDQGQIEQVLLNLYVNAWQSMPGGGNLYIKTENVTIDENHIKPLEVPPGRYVKISVADTGVGMDEATRQRIFDPFFTTKEMGRGTGLGLASAYGIIKNHGGFIDVYSEKNKGTTFSLYLPATGKKIIAEAKLPKAVLKGAGTVLLVDDEKIIIDIGEPILEKLGYNTLTARSGKEAIEIYKGQKNQIDIVILDMIMPEMGGGDTYDELKKINPEIKVLLSSGYSVDGQATEILGRGCDGFIQKPFNMKELSQKIREILNKK